MFCSETPTEKCTGPSSSLWAENFVQQLLYNLYLSICVHVLFAFTLFFFKMKVETIYTDYLTDCCNNS